MKNSLFSANFLHQKVLFFSFELSLFSFIAFCYRPSETLHYFCILYCSTAGASRTLSHLKPTGYKSGHRMLDSATADLRYEFIYSSRPIWRLRGSWPIISRSLKKSSLSLWLCWTRRICSRALLRKLWSCRSTTLGTASWFFSWR